LANGYGGIVGFASLRLKGGFIHQQAPRVVRANLVGAFRNADTDKPQPNSKMVNPAKLNSRYGLHARQVT
jgi:hypothetical protein